jgi:hypothetical protein
MALGFSSGLLTGLQTFGQGGGAIPADPRQRNATQAAGVTNPLLQQFGQGLGGMLGTEMRSPAAVQQAQQQAQQEQLKSSVGAIKDPSSYEGMVQLAQAVMNIDPIQGAQLLAKAEEMKKAQIAELETAGEQSLSTANQARRVQSLATSLEQQGEDALASLVRRGDPEAYKKGISLITTKPEVTGEWKTFGGNSDAIFNTKTAEIRRLDPITKQEVQKTPEEIEADAAKTSLLKVVESKYRYAPPEIKEAMTANIEAGVTKKPKDLTEIMSDDELKRVLTPQKKQQIITDSQGEIRKVRDLRKTVQEGMMATGFGAGVSSLVGGSSAATARGQLQSIQASQAFEALLDIKANNATLGQVSNVELNLLINEVEALTQDMDDETFLQALNNIEQRYLNLISSMSGEMKTVPLDAGKQAYLSSTNVVRVVDDSGDFKDYILQGVGNTGQLAVKTSDGIFRKGADGTLTFTPKYLNK